jgi:Domain of unknown function (DUF6916)
MSQTLTYDQLLAGRSNISRRDFLRGIGFTVAGSALLAIGGQLIATRRLPEVPGETLVRAMFAALRGEAFQVYQEAVGLPALRLIDVRDLHATARMQVIADKERSFSLLFSGPIGQMTEQGTYRFEHDRLGSFALFIVPVMPDQNATYYEAIFNRL